MNMKLERVPTFTALFYDWLRIKLGSKAKIRLRVSTMYKSGVCEYSVQIDDKMVGWIDDDDAEFECRHFSDGQVCGVVFHAADPEFFEKVWAHLGRRNDKIEISAPAASV